MIHLSGKVTSIQFMIYGHYVCTSLPITLKERKSDDKCKGFQTQIGVIPPTKLPCNQNIECYWPIKASVIISSSVPSSFSSSLYLLLLQFVSFFFFFCLSTLMNASISFISTYILNVFLIYLSQSSEETGCEIPTGPTVSRYRSEKGTYAWQKHPESEHPLHTKFVTQPPAWDLGY